MENGEAILGSIYVYAPNKVAPNIFAAVFAISLAGHIYQCFRFSAWKMMGLQVICALLYVAGFSLREYGTWDNYIYETTSPKSQTVLMMYVMSQIFIYVPPPLLELCNYHILSRLFYYIPHKTPIAPNKVLMIFGSLMSLVEVFNGLGVAFSSNPTGTEQTAGRALIMTSLAIQICVIASFFVMTSIFWYRCSKSNIRNQAVPRLIIVLFCSMILIFIRCVYRTVEHAGQTTQDLENVQEENKDSPLERYEWFFWVFEGCTMLTNSLLWNFFHAGRFLPRSTETWVGEDGVETGIPATEDVHYEEQSTGVAAVRLILNIFTVGLWGLIFPRRQASKS